MFDPEINPMDTITILVFSIVTTSVAEFANYIMFYSKADYKKLVKEIDVYYEKIEKEKENPMKIKKKAGEDKSENEKQYAHKNKQLYAMKMRSNVLVGLFFIVTISSLSNYFQGFPVARIPFVPFGIFSNVTHRGLIGEDYTECSYIFLYMITTFVYRTNIQKLFGFEGPKNAQQNPFFEAPKM